MTQLQNVLKLQEWLFIFKSWLGNENTDCLRKKARNNKHMQFTAKRKLFTWGPAMPITPWIPPEPLTPCKIPSENQNRKKIMIPSLSWKTIYDFF